MDKLYQPDLEGMTPAAFLQLVYHPFTEISPLRLRQPPAETVRRVPYFELCLALLHEIAANGVKLTQTGRLPRQLCQLLFDMGLVDDFDVRAWRKGLVQKENDWFHLHTLHQVLQAGQFLNKRRGIVSLTEKTEKLLAKPPALYLELLRSYLLSFDWATPDFFPDLIAQWGVGYGIWILMKHGDKPKPPAFYAEKYLQAYPFMLDYFTNDDCVSQLHEALFVCFEWRFFYRFTELFGLTVSAREEPWREQMAWVKKSALMDAVFQVSD